jgi:hypothetical protein
MWTPIVLLCLTANLTDCIAVGGPLLLSKESCIRSIKEVGIPYFKKEHTNRVVRNYKCIQWEQNI